MAAEIIVNKKASHTHIWAVIIQPEVPDRVQSGRQRFDIVMRLEKYLNQGHVDVVGSGNITGHSLRDVSNIVLTIESADIIVLAKDWWKCPSACIYFYIAAMHGCLIVEDETYQVVEMSQAALEEKLCKPTLNGAI